MYPYNIVVCGCTKNSASYIDKNLNKLYSMHDLFKEFHMVVYENDSTDNTVQILETFKKNKKSFDYISEKGIINKVRNKSIIGPQIIGYGRNRLLEYVEKNYTDSIDYLLMVDLDTVIENFDKDQLKYIFKHDTTSWDALFANCDGKYYDIYALRIYKDIWCRDIHSSLWKEPIYYDCWSMAKKTYNVQKFVRHNQVIIPTTTHLIPVSSAFGGFGIYKYDIIKGIRYSCIANNEITCEHVCFHEQIRKKHNVNFFICPELLMNKQTEHTFIRDNDMNESNNNFVSSRGILKSCDYHSFTPQSSIRVSDKYPHYNVLETINDPIIYICGSAIPHFISVLLPLLKKPFILVSGDCDESIPYDIMNNDQFETFISNPLLIHWFSQNMLINNHPKMTPMPIGLDYHTMTTKTVWGPITSTHVQEKMLNNIIETSKHFSERKVKCYSNFHFSMNTKYAYDRKDALNSIPKELVYYEEKHVPRIVSWSKQKELAFVISPHGGGYDCHRTWEALALGCIPIVKKSNIDVLYEYLPVLIVEKWEDVTLELLEKTIDDFKNKSFQYEKLTLTYWTKKIHSYKQLI